MKDEVEDVRETLCEFYPYIFHCYKYYAAANLGTMNVIKKKLSLSKLPCISMNSFMDLINQTKLLEGGLLR